MNLLKNCCSKDPNVNIVAKQKYVYSVEDYNRTYDIPMAILKLVGLRVTRKDSKLVKFCWDLFYWFEFANLFVVTWLELINMAETARGGSFQDAVEIFRMMPCVGYLLLAMAKSYKIVYYRPIYENLVSELRGMWPRGRVTKEEDAIISTALRQLKYVVQGYYWCNNALLVIFLSPPFVEILKRAMGQNVPLILPFFYWFPFDPFARIYYEVILAFQTWHVRYAMGHSVPLILPFFYWFPFDPFARIYYEVILAFQTWHGLITIWFMLCGDLLFCIFLSHITTQFDLLSVRIKKLIYVPVDGQLVKEYPLAEYTEEHLLTNKAAIDMYNDADWERTHRKLLADIIRRHHALIRLAGDVENLFSFALLVNFFNSSIIICFCGFCCVIVEKWNEMVYKSFLTTALSQTWLLCWYGQRLLESSEGVSDALYNSGWYKATKKIKSSILIMIHRSQKEVHVTTYGFSVISLASYTTIIKTAWSYFTLLLNIYKQ